MKIAFVLHDYQRAGVGQIRYVWELAHRFSRDHEVHVFANRISDPEEEIIRFHHVPAWRMNVLTTALSFAATSSMQIGNDFDIVHSQGFCGFYGNVFTAHICNRAWHLALQKLGGGATFKEFVFNMIATTLEFCTYRFARKSRVIAVSKRVAQDVKRFYHCPAPVRVIYHAVNPAYFSLENRSLLRTKARQVFGLEESDFAYLFVGHLRKGARCCLLALSRLKEGTLLCVSPSPSGPYRALAEELGIAHRVRFSDFTEHVERVYAAADALLLPTPYDTFAMVVTEAMAFGLPVIVSREAGASELIQHGVNGLLLDDVTSDRELAGLMQSLPQDRQSAERLGCAARKTVAPLSWESVAQQTLQVYEELVPKTAQPATK